MANTTKEILLNNLAIQKSMFQDLINEAQSLSDDDISEISNEVGHVIIKLHAKYTMKGNRINNIIQGNQ